MSLDRRRADTAGQDLEPVPTPASTTTAGLAKRFTEEAFTGIETAIAAVNTRALALVGQVRRTALTRQVTSDIDATDIEVYGRAETGSAYNYQGQRSYRCDIVLRAELGIPVAADLLAGDADPRSSTCLARRTRIRADQISADPRARKRRTIPKGQLALALDGKIDHVPTSKRCTRTPSTAQPYATRPDHGPAPTARAEPAPGRPAPPASPAQRLTTRSTDPPTRNPSRPALLADLGQMA